MTRSSSAELAYVDRDDIWRVWDVVEPMLDEAMGYSTDADRLRGWTLDHVESRLAEGSLQLWIALDGHMITSAAVTEIVDTDEGRIAGIPLVSGHDMRTWLGHVAAIEEWARKNNARWLQGQGRDGWARVLRRYGWTHIQRRDDGALQIRKALSHG